jgi:hypothetical protein
MQQSISRNDQASRKRNDIQSNIKLETVDPEHFIVRSEKGGAQLKRLLADTKHNPMSGSAWEHSEDFGQKVDLTVSSSSVHLVLIMCLIFFLAASLVFHGGMEFYALIDSESFEDACLYSASIDVIVLINALSINTISFNMNSYSHLVLIP